jgi:hypothetical protein
VKTTDAQSILSMYGGATAKRAEAIATELRAANLLPKGGRGFNAPDITEQEVVFFALAVAGADRVADAATTAANLACLVNAEGRSLGVVLTKLVAGENQYDDVRHIRVDGANQRSEILYRRDGLLMIDHFFPSDEWSKPGFAPESQGQGFAGRIGHIGGGVIDQLALDFQSDEEGEFVG